MHKHQTSLDSIYPEAASRTHTVLFASIVPPNPQIPAPSSLRRSMAERGQLVPLIVADTNDGYTIIDGRRRYDAAKQLGWTKIEATIYSGTNALQDAAMAITANAERSDNPISDLDAIIALDRAGLDEATIARSTGLGVGTIRKRRKLTRLAPELLEATRAGKVAIGVADRAASLPPARQQKLVERLGEQGKLTGPDIAEVTKVQRGEALAGFAEALAAQAETGPPRPAPTSHERLREELKHLYNLYGPVVGRKAAQQIFEEVWR